MKSAYLDDEPNWILDTFWDSCNSLGYEYNGLPWNPPPPARLTVGDHLFVQCLNCDYSQPPPFPEPYPSPLSNSSLCIHQPR